MSGRWWRAYSRARHDPKLLKLSDKDFRWWFNLVCMASENGGRLPFLRDIAAEFRTTEHAIAVAVERLRLARLFEIEGAPGPDAVYVAHNWNVLQYVSDSSSNRVKQFRERQRNVSVTPSESEAETETDSAPNGAGAGAPVDPVKTLFDDGVKLLTENGCREPNARTLVGKWRREQGDEATQAAIKAARTEGVTEPIAWITQRFAGKPRETFDQRRIREGLAVIHAYEADHDRH